MKTKSMLRYILPLALLLAGCGIDGPPEKPKSATPGISISGEARIGVTGTL